MDKEIEELAEILRKYPVPYTATGIAEYLVKADFHRSVPDKELREKVAKAIHEYHWSIVVKRWKGKHLVGELLPEKLNAMLDEQADYIISLLPSRPVPPEKVVEAIKKILWKFDSDKNMTTEQVARSILALTSKKLTLISDEEISKKWNGWAYSNPRKYVTIHECLKDIAQAQLDHDKQIGR